MDDQAADDADLAQLMAELSVEETRDNMPYE